MTDATDHKPLSEGEMEPWVIVKRGAYYRPDYQGYTSSIEHAGLYSKEDAEERAAGDPAMITAFPLAHFRDEAQRVFDEAKAALDKFDSIPPKPLDGEVLQLMSDRQTDLARLMETTGVKNDGLSSPKQLFERCLAAIDGKASFNAEEAEAKAVLATKEFLESHGYTVTLSCEVTEEDFTPVEMQLGPELLVWVRGVLAKAGLRIVKDVAPTQARPEQVFDSLSEPIRQHSERIQYELRERGWIIVRAAT